jgi:large subunit ribosomal protein L13
MRTYSLKKSEVKKQWILINAKGLVLGRLASIISTKLRGKDKPEFTPHIDCGDHVIIINAEKVYLTSSKKIENKNYFRHTGFPGGIKKSTAKEILNSSFPERVLQKAIKRMLPKNKLANQQIKNLKIYSGDNHPHQAQNPTLVDIKKLNNKNSRRDQTI